MHAPILDRRCERLVQVGQAGCSDHAAQVTGVLRPTAGAHGFRQLLQEGVLGRGAWIRRVSRARGATGGELTSQVCGQDV